jgi:hypothetical protein
MMQDMKDEWRKIKARESEVAKGVFSVINVVCVLIVWCP